MSEHIRQRRVKATCVNHPDKLAKMRDDTGDYCIPCWNQHVNQPFPADPVPVML